MKFVFQEIHKDPKQLQLWKIYRWFSRLLYAQIAIQNLSAEVLFQFYVALYSSNHFWIYCHFTLSTWHLHTWQAANEIIVIKKFPDRQIDLKHFWAVKWRAKLVSVISFVAPITTKAAAGFFFAFPCLPGQCKQAISFSADSSITHWFELLYKILLIY